jgi:hypothetical protein
MLSRVQQRLEAGHRDVAVQRGAVACAHHLNGLPWLKPVWLVGAVCVRVCPC